MSAFLEFHVIQNFAPSNLNRDDAGSPKDALFGGFRRARISSQCQKRAMREYVRTQGLVPQENQAIRTRKLRSVLLDRLNSHDPDEAAVRVDSILAAAGLKIKENLTEYLIFLGNGEISALHDMIEQHWDVLTGISEPETVDKKLDAKKAKKAAKAAIPAEIVSQVKKILDGAKAVDVALFGRMLADLPAVNQEAACQVAHAISTHRVEREFDYFTAVDDIGGESTGAGMIGLVEFNSATLYRYAVLDMKKLLSNLQGDRDVAMIAAYSYALAMVRAIPTGKQNSFAAHNPPEFIGVCLRHGAPISLANAFQKPVFPQVEQTLAARSVAALARHEMQISSAYGDPRDSWAYLDLTGAWQAGRGKTCASAAALAEHVRDLAGTVSGV